jgi:flagellar protein FliO/FliZ
VCGICRRRRRQNGSQFNIMKFTTSSLGAIATLSQGLAPAAVAATEPAANSALFSLIAPLLLIAGAVVVSGLLLKRWRGTFGRSTGPLHLVHVIALGPRERLALVKVGARYLVLGVTPTTISRVAELNDIQDATPGSAAPSDADRLSG